MAGWPSLLQVLQQRHLQATAASDSPAGMWAEDCTPNWHGKAGSSQLASRLWNFEATLQPGHFRGCEGIISACSARSGHRLRALVQLSAGIFGMWLMTPMPAEPSQALWSVGWLKHAKPPHRSRRNREQAQRTHMFGTPVSHQTHAGIQRKVTLSRTTLRAWPSSKFGLITEPAVRVC